MRSVDDLRLSMATAPHHDSKHWRQTTVTWGELKAWMDDPATTKACGNYLLGELDGPTRSRATIRSRSAITLDADAGANEHLPEMWELVLPYAAVIHTTFSSTPEAPRFRVIVPCSRPVTPDEYAALARMLMDRIGADQFDPGSAQPERYMFRPAASRPEWFRSWVMDGEPLPVDELLREWKPDLSSLPTPRPHPNKRNPFELAGVPGAFNRAYTFAEVIEAYDLPYDPAGGDRWQLRGAQSIAGMGPIAGTTGLVYSHHVTDPAYGQACSAFDLVRLHRFAELDDGVPASTPVNRRPSHEAMLELAGRDVRVLKELVGTDFADETADAIADTDWRLGLQLNARTGIMRDTIANWDLVRENDPVFGSLVFNELTLAVETTADLPWRPLGRGGPTFSATDRAALCHHLEREYRLRPARSLVDELVNVTAQQRYVNPLRDYLDGLEWDGVPRVETSLPGVRPTDYTRLVARKVLTAAVARVFEPGIKWDHTLVLFGSEGLGKSWWIDRVARGYSATLGRIGDKDTLLTMQRSWIMVSDEGHSLRKADADVQKEFLTRTEDVFRMPYDREAQVHPRHCVIWGTTNDEVFLRRQEGNRRFLIVRCEERVDFDALTDEYIDQLWAEAVHLYRSGERLYLEELESVLAAEEREAFVEEDALSGVVQEYLDTLVPEDWEEMSPDARSLWLQNRADGLVAPGTHRIRRTCSAQVWVEALGRRFGEHKRTDLLEINTVLKGLPGWKALPGRSRVAGYGPQLVFERTDPEDLEDLL